MNATLVLRSLVMFGAVIGVYLQDLIILYGSALNNQILNYVYILPLLIGYIAFRKRNVLSAKTSLEISKRNPDALTRYVSAISLFALSILLYLYGSITSYTIEYHLFSLPFFALGAVLLFFGLCINFV